MLSIFSTVKFHINSVKLYCVFLTQARGQTENEKTIAAFLVTSYFKNVRNANFVSKNVGNANFV